LYWAILPGLNNQNDDILKDLWKCLSFIWCDSEL